MPHKAEGQGARAAGPGFGFAQFRANLAQAQAQPVCLRHAMQWFARDPAQTVQRRAFDETDAQIRPAAGRCPASAQSLCCRYNSRQNQKRNRAIRSAILAAWPMIWSISGRSCSNVVAGFFVNHFGGKLRARTNEDFPAIVTLVLTNRCGTSVMLAIRSERNRVRVAASKNSKGERVKRSVIQVSGRVEQEQTGDTRAERSEKLQPGFLLLVFFSSCQRICSWKDGHPVSGAPDTNPAFASAAICGPQSSVSASKNHNPDAR